jgi:general secretion pathway protein I
MARTGVGAVRASRSWHEAGFSLLEVLAAFVILSLVATALFRLFGGALNNAGVAEDASRAVLVAQSRLDAARLDPKAGSTSGTEDEGKIAWSTRVEPWTAADQPADLATASQTMPTELQRIVVEVRFPGAGGRERTLELATLRVTAREGALPFTGSGARPGSRRSGQAGS